MADLSAKRYLYDLMDRQLIGRTRSPRRVNTSTETFVSAIECPLQPHSSQAFLPGEDVDPVDGASVLAQVEHDWCMWTAVVLGERA